MATKYFALLTNIGAAKLANAAALGTKIEITEMAVGDGGGSLPTPDASQTALIGEKRRAALNSLSVDTVNSSQIIAEQVIPENDGGFWIREIGLFDADGDMVAVANCAETYKPQLQEGSGRTQTVRMILIVNSAATVSLKIDPSVVLATRKYVDDQLASIAIEDIESVMQAHINDDNAHPQYLKIENVNDYIPAAVPLPWPSAMPPAGWLICDGASFDTTKFPVLATVYDGVLPDLRGVFIRGVDNYRGLDPYRKILTLQGDAIRNIEGDIGWTGGRIFSKCGGVFSGLDGNGSMEISPVMANTGKYLYSTGRFDASTVVPTAAENRPVNVAFNYIVRAA